MRKISLYRNFVCIVFCICFFFPVKNIFAEGSVSIVVVVDNYVGNEMKFRLKRGKTKITKQILKARNIDVEGKQVYYLEIFDEVGVVSRSNPGNGIIVITSCNEDGVCSSLMRNLVLKEK